MTAIRFAAQAIPATPAPAGDATPSPTNSGQPRPAAALPLTTATYPPELREKIADLRTALFLRENLEAGAWDTADPTEKALLAPDLMPTQRWADLSDEARAEIRQRGRRIAALCRRLQW